MTLPVSGTISLQDIQTEFGGSVLMSEFTQQPHSTQRVAPTHRITDDGYQMNIYQVNKGEGLPQHTHVYSHLVFCVAGEIIVRREDESDLIMDHAHAPVMLPAYKWHDISALHDGSVFINSYPSLKAPVVVKDDD